MTEYKIQPAALFSDIVMPEYFRTTIMECIYLPMYFPELFTNARRFTRGFLVFGPPGVGKTYVSASLCNSIPVSSNRSIPEITCYRMYAYDLISKYTGNGEIIIRNVFSAARQNQPSIIIIEELSALYRREGDSEFPRWVKTELLMQIDSVMSSKDSTWVIGVTQLPCDLPSFRRYLSKRIYMTLPDHTIRQAVIQQTVGDTGHNLTHKDLEKLAILTQGLTCSDIVVYLRDASFKPLRLIQKATHFKRLKGSVESGKEDSAGDCKYMVCDRDDPEAESMTWEDLESDQLFVPDLTLADFVESLEKVKPCVTREEIRRYDQFAMQFSMWEPPAQRPKKKRQQSLQQWCCDVIARTMCNHTGAMITDLPSLVNTELPLPDTLRLRVLSQCAEILDLWINEH